MDQEDEQPHQPRNFDGRSTSGLEEVIMGCTSRRSRRGVIINKHIDPVFPMNYSLHTVHYMNILFIISSC
jgi:hypothetical protein